MQFNPLLSALTPFPADHKAIIADTGTNAADFPKTSLTITRIKLLNSSGTIRINAVVTISCVSGTVNIRTGNGTQYSRITAAKNGDTFEWVATAENCWHAVVVNGCVGWVSGKYSKII